MKAFVLAEHSDAAQELCAGARTMADEVVLVAIADMEVPAAVADKVLHVALPEGAVVDDAADTVIAAFDAEQPGVVLVEPTRHMKVVAGKAGRSCWRLHHPRRHRVRWRRCYRHVLRRRGHEEAEGHRRCLLCALALAFSLRLPLLAPTPTEELAWVAPAKAIKLVSSVPVEKSGVDLNKADVVVAAGRGFGAEERPPDGSRPAATRSAAASAAPVLSPRVSTGFPPRSTLAFPASCSAPRFTSPAGISGQMQHMVGCNRATTLFAINKDKNAPVFKQCDYGLVGDIKTVLPALVAAL